MIELRIPGSLALCAVIATCSPALLRAQAAVPPSMDEVAIQSHGSRMNGLIYLAAGEGTHPIVVFLHGYPGNERNLDLAQTVRRAGYHALYVDYRGMWGSGGTFSFAHGLEDVSTILSWIRSPEIAAKYHIDIGRIALVGHSFGGWLALMSAGAQRPAVCVAGIAAWNVGWEGARFAEHADERDENLKYFQFTTEPGAPVHARAADLLAEMGAHDVDWNYISQASKLARHAVLLIAATRDDPAESVAIHEEMAREIRSAGGRTVAVTSYEDDHPFSSHRVQLGEVLVNWLRGDCARTQRR
jgi:uncharacterized protein